MYLASFYVTVIIKARIIMLWVHKVICFLCAQNIIIPALVIINLDIIILNYIIII